MFPLVYNNLLLGNCVQRNPEWVIDNTEGQEIGEGPMYKTWNLSFDFKPSSNLLGWRTFLHITDGGPGDMRRVLSFWLTPRNFGSQAMEARLEYEFDGSTNSGIIPTFAYIPLVMNACNTFSVSQTMRNGKYYFSVMANGIVYSEINGVSYTELENINPRDYPNVKILSSKTATGAPTEGLLSNLQFCSECSPPPSPPPGTYEIHSSLGPHNPSPERVEFFISPGRGDQTLPRSIPFPR